VGWAVATGSAQPHVHRLKPLHPAALAFLAMQHGVPVAAAPMEPGSGAASTASSPGSAVAGVSRGAAIQPEAGQHFREVLIQAG